MEETMRLLLLFVIVLPVLTLLVGWAMGAARIPRAFLTFVLWTLVCEALMFYSLIWGQGAMPVMGTFASIALAMFGPVVGVTVSELTSKQVTPPDAVATKAYEGLTPAQKAQVQDGARVVARFAAKHVGNRLRDKGHLRSAQALHEAGKML